MCISFSRSDKALGKGVGVGVEANETNHLTFCDCCLCFQADKDFVWSLWKKLQVTNPDLTQAVGLVVQR